MIVRPVQLRANADDAVFMIGQAKASSQRHEESTLMAGAGGSIDRSEAESQRHSDSLLRRVAQRTSPGRLRRAKTLLAMFATSSASDVRACHAPSKENGTRRC